ncbi:hypothetical protein ACN27G_09660 [Plantactinospora sp. WMMB334]|uniref:hypothetical protein n=1 Tax=Plantactinospora sp. WMMB334 TaxID=3404119 RepID=UPI003B947792
MGDTMMLSRRAKPYHRRDWRRLWRYCRCGFRWRCPDSVDLVPMPYQPAPVPPLTRRQYRATARATPPVAFTETERSEIRALTPDATPLPTRSRATNRRPTPDASARPQPRNGRAEALTPSPQRHHARHGERV